jgi:hypothetical protein
VKSDEDTPTPTQKSCIAVRNTYTGPLSEIAGKYPIAHSLWDGCESILQTRPGKGRSEIPQFQNTYTGMLAGGSAREIFSQGAGFACAADPRIYGVDTMRNAILHSKSRHASVPKSISVPMGKVFKSGNSAALRLPAGLKVPVGKTFALTPTASGFVATDPVELAKRRKGLSALFGSAPDFPSRES